MKLRYIIAELLIVLVCLVVPPILVDKDTFQFSADYLTWTTIFELLLAVIFNIQHHKVFRTKTNKPSVIVYFYYLPLTLGILMIVYAFFQGIYIIFHDTLNQINSVQLQKPGTITQWLAFTASILIASAFEESLYRQFLPDCMCHILSDNKKFPRIMGELAIVTLFALGHKYLGLLAVANAFICGIVLRMCYLKTKSIYTGTIAHFIYNMTLYMFFFFV